MYIVLEYHFYIISTRTDCVPQCKFGDCNTTIGECICPFGYTGSDCSLISMTLLFISSMSVCIHEGCVCACTHVCWEVPSLAMSLLNLQTVYHCASLEIATRLLGSASVLLAIVEQTAV